MSKKIALALITLIITCGVYIFVSFYYLKDPTNYKNPGKKNNPSKDDVSLSFIPDPLTLLSGQQGSLNVVIKDKTAHISSRIIQLELSFDPNVLYNMKIYPGNYFSNPEVLYEKIDANNGRISYAVKGTNQASTDVVASLNFRAINYGLIKDTEIKFQPKTLIKGDDGDITLSATTGAEIIVNPSLFRYVPTASSSTKLNFSH